VSHPEILESDITTGMPYRLAQRNDEDHLSDQEQRRNR
jgi:hypothetical protein